MDAQDAAATGNERAQELKEQPPQLFPLVLSSDHSPSFIETSEPAKWLSNPSFTFDVSAVPAVPAVPAALTAAIPMASTFEDSDEEEAAAPRKSSYEPVPSPSSSESERRSGRKEKGGRRKRKRERAREKLGHESSRKSGVRAWIGSETKPDKDYYFDVHGDRDNLAFGCLYRMDVARYKLQDHSDLSEFDFELLCHRRSSISSMDIDHDLDVLDSKVKGGRYYSVKFTALERHKGFKHVKIVEKFFLIPGEYIPLVELHTTTENGMNELHTDVEFEESWEDVLLRRTRELNKMSRDFPHDEKVWLAFAEFQDKVASTQPQKAARLQTLEKKISILEKAVELNPDNEELLLCLLKSYQERDTTESLIEKWEKVLMQNFDSVMLWKGFLLVRQGEFSQFKVSDIRKAYGHAIQALSSACNKHCRQGYQDYNLKSKDSSLVQLELGLVDIFINLCRFEWQTGHRELATGLFQAEIEYSLFCPSLLLSSHSKQKLFEHFWNSNGARLGEDGALGWSTWLEKEEQSTKATISEEILEDTEGGWSGWMDPFPKESTAKKEISDERLDVESTEDNPDNEVIPPNDDVEILLKKLGIDVDADPHTEVKNTITWKKWSQEELSRDSEQWMPIRENTENCGRLASSYPEDIQDMDRNEQLSRVILFEDINQYLFSLCSNEARFSLVSQFVEFFGGKISRWTCTNSASWMEKVLSFEVLEDSISEDLRVTSNVCNRVEHPGPLVLESLLGSNSDIFRNTSAMMFLRNAILLCLNAFPRNHVLEEVLIIIEDLYFTQMSTSVSSTKPSRALAKSLLKKDRQDLLLCGVYARSEAAHGNIDIARKIFDMALSSANGLPVELTEHVPLLYLWYAEMEMAACNSSSNTGEFSQRAVHILSCLGGNLKYSPFTTKPSGLDILRSRQGFKEQIKILRTAWAHGDVKESSVALIRSSSLFELLTTGWSAGIQIIEEAFSMALPERRSHSLQLESLWMHYLGTLKKYIKQLKFSRVWEVVAQSLQMYPYNPKSFSTLVQVSCLFTARHKIRQLFDEHMQRKPSVIVWLFALAFELGKPGTEHRVHGLFEKALANDKLQKSALLWRCYLAYETDIASNSYAARRIFFRAIHACPWSKRLWLDGFQKLSSVMTLKELSDLQEVMRDKEIHLRTDIYEILLRDEMEV